jgi:hypothetical protein
MMNTRMMASEFFGVLPLFEHIVKESRKKMMESGVKSRLIPSPYQTVSKGIKPNLDPGSKTARVTEGRAPGTVFFIAYCPSPIAYKP